MKGLIIKDILNLRKNFRTTALVIGFVSIYAFATNNPFYLIGMVTIILSLSSITSMTYDDMSKWDRYALTMPISRKDIVVSKYILSILLSIVSILVSVTISYLLIITQKNNIESKELLLTAYILFFSSLAYISIMLPLIFKFGVEKSRILFIAVIAIITMLFFMLFSNGLLIPNENQFIFLLKISPFILIIILFTSALFSYIIYKNKDI